MKSGSAGWIALVLVFICAIVVCGEPVTIGGAEGVADAFIGYEQAKSEVYRAAVGIPANVRLDEVRALTNGASPATLAYVFELEPSGYIVVTADTQVTPIVAYSYTGTFSWEEVEENILLDMLRQDMANRLRAVREAELDTGVIAENERLWDEYQGRRAVDRAVYSPKVYGPWTLDPWNQGSPYNADCPTDPVTLNQCVVGCVATALAQILNYWQYPTAVSFTGADDYVTPTRGISIDASTADFSGLNYNICSPSDAAKADLSFAAGVSVKMDYSSVGSSAYTAHVAAALAGSYAPWSPPLQRWGYHSADLRTYNPTYSWWGSPYYTTETSFFDQLVTNMIQARPVEMAITGPGGHAIVVDGWQGGRVYHLNYGWGSTAYGWYFLPTGMPYGFNIIKYAVVNIVPTTATHTLTTAASGPGTVKVAPSGGTLTAGTHAIVSAIPTAGCYFDHWTGALTGSQNPAMLILDADKSVTAVFGGSSGTVSTKKWTVMVYLAADNNLGGGTPGDPDFMDIDEMETALITSNAAVNVVVLWDKPGTNNTNIYWVQPDATEGSLATYTLGVNMWTPPGGPEENMGEQTTLTDFLDWVSDKFVSDYYALILWDHGAGWEPRSLELLEKGGERAPTPGEPPDLGICWDDTDGYDYLTTKEIVNGISESILLSVDNLGMDACLMQILSVAYEMRDIASFLTASEETEWGWGWAYHQILSSIATSTTPLQLAQSWGATRSRHLSGGLDTISSLDLSQVGALATAVSNLGNRLATLLSTPNRYYEILEAKLIEAFSFAAPEYVDLDDLCLALKAVVNDATTGSLADTVRARIATAVVAMSNASGYTHVGGVSIYFPHYHEIYYESIPHIDYQGAFLAFCTDHSWDDFLNAWLATDYADPFETNDTPATAYDLGTYYGSWQGLFYEADFDDDAGLWTADWYMITADHTFDLDLRALCTEYYSDTVLYAYASLADANADTYFAWNDDGAYGYGSRLTGSGFSPGTYYLKVKSYFWGNGANEDYALYMDLDQPTPAVFRVTSDGAVLADQAFYGASFQTGAADVAEWVLVSEPVEAGDVLELDPENPQHYRKSTGSCSSLVAGVVSTQPGFVLGSEMADSPVSSSTLNLAPRTSYSALLALLGIVPVKACDEGGPIKLGDLLVPSSIPGYVRRWDPETAVDCPFVGKALEALSDGLGRILALLVR